MKQITDLHLGMISNSKRAILFEDELLLADNVGQGENRNQRERFRSILPMQTNFILLIFCLHGEMKFNLNQREVCICANEVMIVKNNDIVESLSERNDFEVFVIGFSNKDYFENTYTTKIQQVRTYCLLNNHFSISPDDMEHYHLLYNMMRSKITDDTFLAKKEFVAKSMSLMGVVFHDNILKSWQENRLILNQRLNIVFDRFMQLLMENYSKHHSLQFYADELCMSAKYLSQVVHMVSGHFASEWITQYLIDEAKMLLLDGHHTSTQVADELGFTNASYFLRFFKRETGMTPLQYQKY